VVEALANKLGDDLRLSGTKGEKGILYFKPVWYIK
jgi:hypothetical protein